MSIFTALNTASTLEEAFRAKDCTSDAMKKAIKEWFDLYYDRRPTKDFDPCQRIAYTVVNKLTKTCFGEYSAASKDEYAQAVIDALNESKDKAMQLTLVGGEAFLKPVPVRLGTAYSRWIFNVIPRNNVLVFGRNAAGKPCDIGIIERSTHGTKFYTLLERRTVEANGQLTIRNTLYSSQNKDDIGSPVSLQALPQYEGLPDEYTYNEPLGGLGFVHLSVPTENTVDGSADGVSVYAAAVGLIRNIDHNEALLNREFDLGRSRVFVSDDMTKRDKNGKRYFDDDLFVGIDGDPGEVGVTSFSPTLREESFLSRKREYLRNVESIIGIKRGLLSEVEAVERTAKEVTSSEGDYNLTIIDLQEVWEQAVRDAIKLCGTLGKVHAVQGAHDVSEDAVTIDWGNGVLFDEEKDRMHWLDLVARGLVKGEYALGKILGEPVESESDLNKIREKYMPELDSLMAGEE